MARSYDIAILSQKVEYLESAGIELPKVTSSDNGKVLQVVSGKWKKGSKMPDAVSANPEGEITNELAGIQIGDEKYKINTPVITRKTYTVTTVTNALVSPYGAFVQVQLSSDIAEYGDPISVVSCSPSTNPVAACFNEGKNSCNIYSATAATFDITVTYSSIATIV